MKRARHRIHAHRSGHRDALLATIMVLLYSGLTFALRSWDAGDANGRRVADRRLGENFLRPRDDRDVSRCAGRTRPR
jgi:hypothetical protein